MTVKLAYNPTSNNHTTKGKITYTVSLVFFSSVAFLIFKKKKKKERNRKEERQNLSCDNNFKACPRHVLLEGMFFMSSVCSFSTDTSYERAVCDFHYHQ